MILNECSVTAGMIFCTRIDVLAVAMLIIVININCLHLASSTLRCTLAIVKLYRSVVYVNFTPFCNWEASIKNWGEIFCIVDSSFSPPTCVFFLLVYLLPYMFIYLFLFWYPQQSFWNNLSIFSHQDVVLVSVGRFSEDHSQHCVINF